MQAEPSTLDPDQLLLKLGTGYWVTQVLSVAARTDMLEQLLDGPVSAEDIADRCGLHADSTARVLRGCVLAEVTSEPEPGLFALTELGRGLTKGHPRSLRDAVIMMGDPGHWLPWGELEHTVRTGEASYRKALGVENVFHYFDQKPQEAERFHHAMASMTRVFLARLQSAYDFTPFRTIADIGGGHGLLLGTVLQWAPAAKGLLFDQPEVLQGADTQLQSLGVDERVTRVGGSFFDSIPAGADLYMMKHVLHDWTDEDCHKILCNIRQVIPPDGRLLVFDCLLPEHPQSNEAVLMDLNMMVMTGGRERGESDFAGLFARSGFALQGVVRLAGAVQGVEAIPVSVSR